jgi:hypothetical protein
MQKLRNYAESEKGFFCFFHIFISFNGFNKNLSCFTKNRYTKALLVDFHKMKAAFEPARI